MDVKLKNQIGNWAASEIEGYGQYAWTKGSDDKLKNIPRLPDELFDMIRDPTNKQAPAPTITSTDPTRAPTTPPQESFHVSGIEPWRVAQRAWGVLLDNLVCLMKLLMLE
jgi:hypothetical protein